MSAPQSIGRIPIVPAESAQALSSRQLTDYREHRIRLIEWMRNVGKDPERAKGYAEETAYQRAYRTDRFYRWVWSEEGRYTTNATHDHADDFIEMLAYSDGSASHKSSLLTAIKMLFRWRAQTSGGEEWDPERRFTTDDGASNPRDYLTKEERTRLREAVLELGSVPHYNSLSPNDRGRWKTHLAQRFGKPKNSISPDDFDRANGWKYPSLIWCALDAGLRPIEVARATISWVDLDNNVLRIPEEDSSKNRDNWVVGLTDRTTTALGRWLDERAVREKYEGRDAIWLTREGNPYKSHALNHLLRRCCDEAGIRDVSWYAIRHSVGTYMAREEGLAAAQAQLRHKSEKTTMKYDQTPVEDRRNALDKMG